VPLPRIYSIFVGGNGALLHIVYVLMDHAVIIAVHMGLYFAVAFV